MTLNGFLKEINKLPGKRRTMANDISKFWEDGKQIEMITEKKRKVRCLSKRSMLIYLTESLTSSKYG